MGLRTRAWDSGSRAEGLVLQGLALVCWVESGLRILYVGYFFASQQWSGNLALKISWKDSPLNPKPYLDPKSRQNNGLYGHYYGLRAIISHAFGV